MDGVALIAAIVALFVALGARSRIAALQAQLASALDELRALQSRIAEAPPAAAPAEVSAAEPDLPVRAPAPAQEGAHAVVEPAPSEPGAAEPAASAAAVFEPQAPAGESANPVVEPAAFDAEPAALEPPAAEALSASAEAEPSTSVPQTGETGADAGAIPQAALAADPGTFGAGADAQPEPPPDRPQVTAAPAPLSFEERLGARWAVWVGGAALALGGVLLVRYSIEQGFFGPALRVALGGLFSLVLVAAGEWFRLSERASPVEAVPSAHIPGILTAAGTVSAFATAYAAHALYQYLGPAAAFSVLGAIALATMLAAALHGPALAGLGLAGALVVPMLVASQEPNPWPLVLYLAVVAVAAHALARVRLWLWLAVAVVAGAIVWGFALIGPASAGTPGAWPTALFVHVGLQLALAAMALAVVPHWRARDAEAAPDWIATLALAALAALAVLALDATPAREHWATFATATVAMLSLAAWYSTPAAGAAVLAGGLLLAAMVLWPGSALVPAFLPITSLPLPLPRLAAVIEGGFRLPDDISGLQTFAALAALLVGAPAIHRLWRAPALPLTTTGFYALAGAVMPLLALVVAYLRVTQFGRSIPFALCAAGLAAAFGLIAYAFSRGAADRTPAAGLRIGAYGAAAATAAALGLVMVLDRGYLTAAFAVGAFATAKFAVAGRVALLRHAVVVLGLVVLGRLVWDPRIMGPELGTWPVLNWLLVGYGVPAVAFLAAGRILGREAQDAAARLCDALGVLFAALLVFFEIRHALNGGDPLARTSGHVEQGLFALMSFGFAAVLIRMDPARGNPVFRAAALLFGVVSAGVTVVGLGAVQNPLLTGEAVQGRLILSTLVLAYLLPGLAALVLARIARGARPEWYVNGATGLGIALLFGYVALELRHAFQGESLAFWHGASAPEAGLLTLAGLAFAAVLVHLDATRLDPALRQGSVLLGLFAAVVAVLGLGLAENPLLRDLVRGPLVFDTLVPAYLLPALGAFALASAARGVRPQGYVSIATWLGLALLFGYVALEVRRAFHGENLLLSQGIATAEAGLVTLAALVFAVALVRIDRAYPEPALRQASFAFGTLAAVVAFLGVGITENPLLVPELVSGPVVLSTLVPAYLLPGLGALALAYTVRGRRSQGYASLATWLALALLFAYVALEVRHAFHGENLLLLRGTNAAEAGLITLAGFAFAAALIRVDQADPEPALRQASFVFGVLAAAAALLGLGVNENPLFAPDPVTGPVGLSSLVPGYLVPGVGAIVLARTARGVRPAWYASGAAALALLLVFGYVSLEVRHAFQGESLSATWGATAPEVWSYSVAWLALGITFLFLGLWRGSVEIRLASAVLVVLSVLKVFLYDLTGIGGFWRAFSMICLGAVLIGIGLVYQKLVFARPPAPAAAAAPAGQEG